MERVCGSRMAGLSRGHSLTRPSLFPRASGRACGQGLPPRHLPRHLPRLPCRQTAQPQGLLPGKALCKEGAQRPRPRHGATTGFMGCKGPEALDALATLASSQHKSRPGPPPPNAPQGPQTPVEEPVWSALQNHVNSELWGHNVNANAGNYYRKQ